MKKYFLFLSWLGIILTACEQPGDFFYAVPVEQRVTINSFTEAGDPWMVTIGPTNNYMYSFIDTLIDARVMIYEDGNFVEQLKPDLPYIGEGPAIFRSRNHNTPKPGHHYKIVVEADNYPIATSTYRQPEVVPAEIKFDLREKKKIVITHHHGNGTSSWVTYDTTDVHTFDISITFTDPPGENFYDFWITASDKKEISESTTIDRRFLSKTGGRDPDPILSGQMIDDKSISEKKVTYNFVYVTSVSQYQTPGFTPPLPEWFRIALRSMTKEAYKYIIQVRKTELAQFDPYAQPITTFTNVQNGLGVFGGYTPYAKTYYYKME